MLTAKLSWPEGQPYSDRFNDIYFSSEDGLAESSYVFLGLNQLEQKFAQTKEHFSIVELGFGTGLNFFLSWQLFINTADTKSRLNFISIEKFPLSKEELIRAWQSWPTLKIFTDELAQKLPNLQPGFHRVTLAQGRISLTLIYAEVQQALEQIETPTIDAWFLDGFAPSKNPEMWSQEVLNSVSALSNSGSSLATFTAAGAVKRGLEACGWKVEKVKGYGNKRESLKATLEKKFEDNKEYPPWFSIKPLRACSKKQEVLVIGAGLAGCFSAYSLAQKGFKVKIIERDPTIANRASGNLAGLAIPYLSIDNNLRHKFFLEAFDHARREIEATFVKTFSTGVLHRLPKERVEAFNNSFIELGIPAELTNVFDDRQLFYPQAICLSPPILCQQLLDKFRDKIEVVNNYEVLDLVKDGNEWVLNSSSGFKLRAETVVICNSFDALNFKVTDWLPLTKVRGELALVEDKNPKKQISHSLCGNSYLIPLGEDKFLVGASYDYVFLDQNPSQEIQTRLLNRANEEFGVFSDSAKIISSRVAFRASTYDRIPYVGAVPDIDFCLEEYKSYRRGFRAERFQDCQYLKGLYLNVGHGSRGLVSAPICAEIISSLISAEILPMEKELIDSLTPNRWFIRQLARGHAVDRDRKSNLHYS
jgi:tRNA 5-methylaminomethyl-2-thiouridine biosynthesis bifunctional protein